MNAFVYKRPAGDGTVLVVDFTAEAESNELLATRVPSHRRTTSSRAPGQVRRGTIWTDRKSWQRCADCGGIWNGRGEPGRHAPRGTPDGTRNCVGKLIEAWP